jgi:hypothetical protein
VTNWCVRSGFVARCDGFIVVPAHLLVPWRRAFPNGAVRETGTKDKQIVLTFAAADGDKLPAPQIVPQPRHFLPDQIPYALAKSSNVHLRGLPLLARTIYRRGCRSASFMPAAAKTIRLLPRPSSAKRPRRAAIGWSLPACCGKQTGRHCPRSRRGAAVVDAHIGFRARIVPAPDPDARGVEINRPEITSVRCAAKRGDGALAPASEFVTLPSFTRSPMQSACVLTQRRTEQPMMAVT